MSINKLTIGEIITKTVPFFNEKGIPNPRLEADLLLAYILDLPRVSLYSQWDRLLEPTEVQRYREVIVKRVQGLPLAYITGKKSFLSWDFIVNPEVLIPRPETELLVETACEQMKNRPAIHGIDIGTGSGAIVVALAKLVPASIWCATDISNEALTVAAENARRQGVDSRITFLLGDLLKPVMAEATLRPKFNLIVANLPYIPSAEIADLQVEVRREPILALDGGPDGLAIYRRLFPQLREVISDDGLFIMEHGDDQKAPLEALAAEYDLTSESFSDLAGKDRILICRPLTNTHA
ncbi:MAG TPA: peptide chain release factor N(5)-glutamine methyltransferase [Firmicutes bacterium]|jgi:release factor glutamine methyltransferase|nr:peptide chain release factor N(5)-glutamine methyltransferase [Bacillota bacterium]